MTGVVANVASQTASRAAFERSVAAAILGKTTRENATDAEVAKLSPALKAKN